MFPAVLTVIASGTCFGWVTPILVRLLGPDSEVPMTTAQSSWVVSVIEVGNVFSPIPAGILVDKIGRKLCILSTGPLYLSSWLITLYVRRVLALYTARIIQGFALGIVYTAVPLYLGEISSPKIRGIITNMFQNAFYFGVLFEYCVGPYLSYTNLTRITAAIPVLFIILFSFQPESPYFLVMKGKEKEAADSLAWLRGKSTDEVEEELADIITSVKREMGDKASWKDILSRPEDRRALLMVQVVGGVKILSGVAPVLSYSTHLFSQTSKTFLPPEILTIIMGTVMFVSSFFTSLVIDLSGRRPIVLISTLGCSCSMLSISLYYFLDEKTDVDVSSYSFVGPLSAVLYCTFLAFGLDPVSVTYRAELFPANTRSFAASICSLNFTIGSFFTLKFYQVVSDGMGNYFNYLMFSIFSFVGAVWIYFIAIETKGKSLSEVQTYLSEITRKNKKKRSQINTEYIA